MLLTLNGVLNYHRANIYTYILLFTDEQQNSSKNYCGIWVESLWSVILNSLIDMLCYKSFFISQTLCYKSY